MQQVAGPQRKRKLQSPKRGSQGRENAEVSYKNVPGMAFVARGYGALRDVPGVAFVNRGYGALREYGGPRKFLGS